MGTSGANCTNLAQCRWFLNSAYVRSNVRYTWSTAAWNAGTTTVAATTIDCSTDANRAPLSLFPDDPHTIDATKTDYARPCVQMANSAGAVTTFWYTSVAFENVNQCGGAALISAVPGCMDNDPADVIEQLKLQLPVDGSCQNTAGVATPVGAPCGITPTGAGVTATTIAGSNPALNPNVMEGLLAGGGTPLGPSLAWTNTNRATVFANQVAGQPNYVILLTDGIDNCGGTAPATAAASLYANGITVFVVAMGIDSTTVDAIANAGSGGQFDAFSAQNPQELVNALSSIINQTASSGTFSAQPSASAWVFEFGASTVFPALERLDPFDSNEASPRFRYAKVVPATFQPLFEMPGFVGHLRAFLAPPAPAAPIPVEVWDAGDMLCRQITGFPATTGIVPSRCNVTGASATAMGNGSFTFADMIGTNGGAPGYTQNANARLKRRIFTTSGNGVFPYEDDLSAGARQQLVPLWPPTTGTSSLVVDPDYNSGTYPNGSLDVPLGIAAMDFATLQSTFGACRVSTVGALHADCSVAAARESRARKEAREMILAYAAGAVVATTGGLPDRTPNTGAASVRGQILYEARNWMLGDSTLSSAVAVTQPLKVGPTIHVLEYTDYKLLRTAALPRMSVVYLGANDMLHAFRAGPAGAGATAEQGGQELWGFVPYDQLSKLRLLLLEGQSSSNHKYVIASGLRSADVFVPMPSTPGTGEWRTYLFFGRGIAGKHLTALDVSFPGDFTTPALETTPPLAVWNRGNPDTQDGTAAGPANSLTNTSASGSVDLGVNDLQAYATMGQTWSTPALSRVRTVTEATDPTPGVVLNEGLEFMLYAGSGYSNVATEGHNFYSINPLTGDVISSTDVGSNAASIIANAIPAAVAVFNPGQLQLKPVRHPASTVGTRVYVGDLHGRLWKFPTDDPDEEVQLWDYGVAQPIATAVALHNYNSLYDTPPSSELLPHIYLTTGNDRRVPTPPAEPDDFLFVGVRDNEDPPPPDPIATELFRFTLPERYRGSTQPTTFWTEADATGGQAARVAVAVTRYNPISSASCRSSFDSLIYLVSAGLGEAAFDVNGDGAIDDTDRSWEIQDEKVTGVRISHGKLVVDKGLDPDPDKVPPMRPKEAGSPMIWTSGVNVSGSMVCR